MFEKEKPLEGPLPYDRPLECSECKRPVAVHYTEIVGDVITHTIMCQECPVLQRFLFGASHPPPYAFLEGSAGLACGNCGTTLDAVRMGSPLGCKNCYEVFEEVVLTELQSLKKLPPRVVISKKSQPLHIGRTPGETEGISPATRLLALNEALSETLKKEDYEQAAMLRDQIKALTEKTLEGKNHKGKKISKDEEEEKGGTSEQ